MIDLAEYAIPLFPIHVRRPDGQPLCGAAWTDTGLPYTHPAACDACHTALREKPEWYLAYQLGMLVRDDFRNPWVALGYVAEDIAYRIAARTAAEYARRICEIHAAVAPRSLLVVPVRAAGAWMLDDLVTQQVIARAPFWFEQTRPVDPDSAPPAEGA